MPEAPKLEILSQDTLSYHLPSPCRNGSSKCKQHLGHQPQRATDSHPSKHQTPPIEPFFYPEFNVQEHPTLLGTCHGRNVHSGRAKGALEGDCLSAIS